MKQQYKAILENMAMLDTQSEKQELIEFLLGDSDFKELLGNHDEVILREYIEFLYAEDLVPYLDRQYQEVAWVNIKGKLIDLDEIYDSFRVELQDEEDEDKEPKVEEPALETNQLKEKYGAPLDTSKRPKVNRVKHWHSFLEEFGVDEGHYDFYCKKGDFFIAHTEPKTLIHLGAVDTVAFNTKDEPVKLEDIGLDRDFLLRMDK